MSGEARLDDAFEGVLDGAVFEGVEGDDGDAGVWGEEGGGASFERGEQGVEAAQFVVDGDAQGLEGAGSGIDRRAVTEVSGVGGAHHIGQVRGGQYRPGLSLKDKFSSDLPSEAILAQICDETGKFGLGEGVHKVGSGGLEGGIKTHVERAFTGEGKAPLGAGDLVGGEAKIGQEEVGMDAALREGVGKLGEVPQGGFDGQGRIPHCSRFEGCEPDCRGDVRLGAGEIGGVDIVEDDAPTGGQMGGDGGGVAAQPGGGVDIDLTGAGGERAEDFARQDRGVIGLRRRAWGDGSGHAERLAEVMRCGRSGEGREMQRQNVDSRGMRQTQGHRGVGHEAPAARLLAAVVVGLAVLMVAACAPKVNVAVGAAGGGRLEAREVMSDAGSPAFRVAMIDVRGVIYDAQAPGLLGPGPNPVDRFAAALRKAEEDARVKAVIVRISSPGGTVTGSHVMHEELRAFRSRTGKPVVISMGEIAASGGYYLALAGDEVIAEPTTITGSIGVIVPMVNVSEGLGMIGVRSRSIVSGANKDLANPLEPMREGQYAILQRMVDDMYARFAALVRERRPGITNLEEATDGRVVTGERALQMGLIDGLGGVREAFARAKALGGVSRASLVKYVDEGRLAMTPYAATPIPAGTEINVLSVQVNDPLGAGVRMETSGMYYVWLPGLWP